MNNAGYQSSSRYLTLPDTLRASFPFNGGMLNVKQAPAPDFHAFISQFVEEIADVDTNIWPIHHRWRIINACLASGVLQLLEVPNGYQLEVVELLEVETPEVGSSPNDAA